MILLDSPLLFFDFNKWSSLLLPFFIQGVIFFFLLQLRSFRENRWPDLFLSAIILIYTLRVGYWMLGFAGWYDSHDSYSTFMFYFPFNHWFLLGPAVYFYFKSLTNKNFKLQSKDLWHFLPELLVLCYEGFIFLKEFLIDYLLNDIPLSLFYNTKGPMADGIEPLESILFYLSQASIIIYFIVTIRMYRRYRDYLNQNFSKTDQLKFTWLRNFLYAVMIGQIIQLGFFLAEMLTVESLSYIDKWYSFFFLGIIIYYLCIFGFNIDNSVFQKLEFEEEERDAKQPDSANTALKQQILQHISAEKPFLDPELSLTDLAKQLNYPTNQLSQIINKEMGKNFNEFINAFRIDTVKEKLLNEDNSHLSILGVAFESGFNSKATFNRVFKKLTGQTPSEFVRTNK